MASPNNEADDEGEVVALVEVEVMATGSGELQAEVGEKNEEEKRTSGEGR